MAWRGDSIGDDDGEASSSSRGAAAHPRPQLRAPQTPTGKPPRPAPVGRRARTGGGGTRWARPRVQRASAGEGCAPGARARRSARRAREPSRRQDEEEEEEEEERPAAPAAVPKAKRRKAYSSLLGDALDANDGAPRGAAVQWMRQFAATPPA